jgi:hypothetical protein
MKGIKGMNAELKQLTGSCLGSNPRRRHGQQALKPWVVSRQGVEQGRELLELVGVQHEGRNTVDQVALLGQCP